MLFTEERQVKQQPTVTEIAIALGIDQSDATILASLGLVRTEAALGITAAAMRKRRVRDVFTRILQAGQIAGSGGRE